MSPLNDYHYLDYSLPRYPTFSIAIFLPYRYSNPSARPFPALAVSQMREIMTDLSRLLVMPLRLC